MKKEELHCTLIEVKKSLEDKKQYLEDQNKILMQLINKKDNVADEYIQKHQVLFEELKELKEQVDRLTNTNRDLQSMVEKYKPMYSIVYTMIVLITAVLGWVCYV